MTQGTPTGPRFRFADPGAARGFAPLDGVLEDTRLDVAARLIYFVVKQHAWVSPDVPLRIEDIGATLGRTTGQVYRSLRELVAAGVLQPGQRMSAGQPEEFVLGVGRAAVAGSVFRSKLAPPESRGAVIPAMTAARRAEEERLAALLPMTPPVRRMDPAQQEAGLDRVRSLRRNLAAVPDGVAREG